jgi:hypothetical protein
MLATLIIGSNIQSNITLHIVYEEKDFLSLWRGVLRTAWQRHLRSFRIPDEEEVLFNYSRVKSFALN